MEPNTESQAYPFTPAEFERLAVFRQAVLAGFYTDQLHDDEAGWKDVVWLGPNQTIRVQHEFATFTGRFVFHCHNGSHKDHDMMSQFEVDPGGNQ